MLSDKRIVVKDCQMAGVSGDMLAGGKAWFRSSETEQTQLFLRNGLAGVDLAAALKAAFPYSQAFLTEIELDPSEIGNTSVSIDLFNLKI